MHAPSTDRDELLDRLRKAEGQVRGVQRMIEGGQPCTEVLTQLAAARAALAAVAMGVLEADLQQKLRTSGGDAAVREAVVSLHLLVR